MYRCGSLLNVAVYRPCIDLVEPSSVVLVSVDVERNGQFFTSLYIEVIDFLLTEHPEAAFARVLVVCFYYEFL